MAKIALRAYLREIESMVSHGQTEEAIAHSKYVLRSFPKCIDAYRLLGKSYLESQRYSEAADILQRILSVFPDDFVSQIGMSIIREDEANLDAAIFHMERAFEVQPSNAAVQEELRRLYGRRDGIEPPRIRLTRGALVRMYARGDLYRQAIAEIRAALAEEPNRIDLEIILAKMFYLSGQKAEATEVSGRLVSRLPYCYEANRILAEVLPGTSRSADAHIYQQRITALDPYYAFVSANAPTTDLVPENAIMLDRLQYTASAISSDQPEWAQMMGVSLDKEEQKPLPDWLSEVPVIPASTFTDEAGQPVRVPETSSTPPEPSVIPDFSAPEASKESAIPEWMREAGWSESTGAFQEVPVNFDAEEMEAVPQVPAEAEAITPSAMPDWLKEIAPGGDILEQQPDAAEQEKLSLLDQILPAKPEAPENQADKAAVGQPPDWLADFTTEPEPEIREEKAADWLAELGEELAVSEVEPSIETKTQQPTVEIFGVSEETSQPESILEQTGEDKLPDWLSSLDQSVEPLADTAEPASDSLPGWLASLEESVAEPKEPGISLEAQQFTEEVPIESIEGAAESLPTWLQGLEEESTAQAETIFPMDQKKEQIQIEDFEMPKADESISDQIVSEMPVTKEAQAPNLDKMDIEASIAWLESLAAQQGVDQETLVTKPEERSETPPEWIQSLTQDIPAIQEEISVKPNFEEPLSSLVEEFPGEPIIEEPIPGVGEITSESISSQAIIEEALKMVEEPISNLNLESQAQPLDFPDVESSTEEIEQDVTPSFISAALEETMPVFFKDVPETPLEEGTQKESEIPDDVDSAIAWLEGLAARQGVSEEELTTKPEERIETPPTWVSSEPEITTLPIQEEPVMEISAPPFVEEAAVEEAIPDWIQEYQEGTSQAETAIVDEAEEFSPPEWVLEETPAEKEEPVPAITEKTIEEPAILKEVHEAEGITEPEQTAAEENITPVKQPSLPRKPTRTRRIALKPEVAIDLPELDEVFSNAQSAMDKGNLGIALEQYKIVIKKGYKIDRAIQHLQEALYRYPVEVSLWEALGDAHAKKNNLQEALEAYTKAEELLK